MVEGERRLATSGSPTEGVCCELSEVCIAADGVRELRLQRRCGPVLSRPPCVPVLQAAHQVAGQQHSQVDHPQTRCCAPWVLVNCHVQCWSRQGPSTRS